MKLEGRAVLVVDEIKLEILEKDEGRNWLID